MVDYPFEKIYNNVMDNIDQINLILKEYYDTFPCILCDHNNHKYIDIEFGKVFMQNSFCRDILSKTGPYVQALNVDMISLMHLI